MELGLHFGALAPSISEQIKVHLNYADDEIEQFSKLGQEIIELYVCDIITDSEKTKACNRLMKKITKYLNNLDQI